MLLRDPLLAWVVLLPFGLALLLRMLIPAIDSALRQAAFDLSPYHRLIMSGYLMTAPGIVGMVMGFLLLDERDAKTLSALRVMPMSMRRYLTLRMILPLLLGLGSTLVGYPLVGLTPMPFGVLVSLAAISALSAPTLALVLAALAPNKVAGFALVKVLNVVNLAPILAFFAPMPWQLLAGVLPAFWPMRAMWAVAAGESWLPFMTAGVVVGVVAFAGSALLFDARSSRHG
jgi:fluoroquinolone transport system permease protein